MPKANEPKKAANKLFVELVHKLVLSLADDNIINIIKTFMNNSEIYHDIILQHYINHHHTDVQKLYFKAIKAYAEAIRFTANAEDSHTDSQAVEAMNKAQQLLNQYALFKHVLGQDYQPDHVNTQVKAIADAYLLSLEESLPLTDYRLFYYAHHYSQRQDQPDAATVVANTVLANLDTFLNENVTTKLHTMYVLANHMINLKIHFLTGSGESHSLKHHSVQPLFFKKHVNTQHTSQQSALQTYLDEITRLEKIIDEFQEILSKSLSAGASKEMTKTITKIKEDLDNAYQQLLHDQHEITAFHYKH